LAKRTHRQIKQITTRKYQVAKGYRDLDGMRRYFASEGQFRAYQKNIQSLIHAGRHYDHIADAMCDSLFDVEVLGISNNGQAYMMVADYGDCLDYILHRLCGCKLRDIRKIEDYSLISRAILGNDLRDAGDIPLSRLLFASSELKQYFAALTDKGADSFSGHDDQVSWVAYKFYSEVLSLLGFIKFYTTVVVCNSFLGTFGRKGIIRSTSYSKIAATVSGIFDEVVTIHDLDNPNIEDYKVVYRTFRPYEYLGEVITKNEFSRKV